MDIGCLKRAHVPSWVMTVSMLAFGSFVGPLTAQQACVLSEQDRVSARVEACVQMLREEPSGGPHPEYLKPIQDAIGSGPYGGAATGYTEFNVGDEKFSAAFTHCVKIADPAYKGSATSSVNLPDKNGDDQSPARYQYTNKYQVHQLRDTQRKIVYDLIRIPEGSIEAMGTWYSDKPASSVTAAGCVNSNGDPCGTLYLRNRAGDYEPL